MRIGFILAKSPRQIEINKVKDIINKLNSKVLKVAVVVDEHIDEAVNAVREGWLDAVQFQGDVREDIIESLNISWYKVIRVNNRADFNQSNYYSPIILYDTFSKEVYGGTGKQIDDNLLEYAKNNDIDLYLAGGITPGNAKSIISKYNPLLIDIGSGVEKSPGIKDHDKIRRLFEELK